MPHSFRPVIALTAMGVAAVLAGCSSTPGTLERREVELRAEIRAIPPDLANRIRDILELDAYACVVTLTLARQQTLENLLAGDTAVATSRVTLAEAVAVSWVALAPTPAGWRAPRR